MLPAAHLGVVLVPFGLIDFRLVEGFADGVLHAHAGGGVAGGVGRRSTAAADNGIAGALGVLAQSELDAGSCAFEDEALRVLAPAHLNRQGTAADGVGRAVQDVGGGDAAGERAVDGDVFGVEHVANVHHGGYGHASLVDAALD